MKLNRKWLLVIALVLSMATAISGTLAYLTDTDSSVNTFTVGNVKIELTEPSYEGNTPTLLPGVEITKDPQITNIGNTEAWVWMEITVPTDLINYIDWNTTDWTITTRVDDTNTIVTMKRETKLDPNATTAKAFTKVSLPASLTKMPESLGTGTIDIVVNAYAIQDANFANVNAAMAAYSGSYTGDTDDDGAATPAFTATVSNDEELATALAGNATNILLKSNTYGVIDVSKVERTVTISAADGANVKLAGVNGQSNNTNKNITVKGVTIDNSLQTAGWFTGTGNNIKPCVGLWGGNFTFENCKFCVSGESGAETGVMSWWTTESSNHETLNFKNCSFNGSNEQARAMQIYGHYDLNVTNCSFNTAKDYSIKYVGKAGYKAVMTNNTVTATENFVELGTQFSEYAGTNYSITFTGNKLATGINHYLVANDENQSIIVDGVVANVTQKTISELLGSASSIVIDNRDGTLDVTADNYVSVNGANITVNGGTVDAGTTGGFNHGIAHAGTVVYNDATIKGSMSLYGDKVVFNRCTVDLTQIQDYIWAYGAEEVEFNSCTFNTLGKAVLLYGYGPIKLTINNCVFNDSNNGSAGKAAVEIGDDYGATYELIMKNTTVNGFATGENTDSKLWGNKNSMDKDHLSVTIDGTKVY